MTVYIDNAAKFAREERWIIVINLPRCVRDFGVAPCTGTGTKCWKTTKTCKDRDNFLNESSAALSPDFGEGVDLRLTVAGTNPLPGEVLYPIIREVKHQGGTELDPARALTITTHGEIALLDVRDNDVGQDPYLTDRDYDPLSQGSLVRKLFTRNFLVNRPMLIKQGFKGMAEADYLVNRYVLTGGRPPGLGGGDGPSLYYEDPLKLARDVTVPREVTARVTDNPLTAGAGTINYALEGEEEFPDPAVTGVNFFIKIEDEIVEVSANDKISRQLTAASRGRDVGFITTTAAQHNADTKIELIYVAEDANPVDILLDIMKNSSDLCSAALAPTAADIDTTGYEAERDLWFTAYAFTGVEEKPRKASEAIKDLLMDMWGASQWWSEEDQKFKFRAMAPRPPSEPTVEISDSDGILSIDPDPNEGTRVSRGIIYYKKKALGDDDNPDSYEADYFYRDPRSEGADYYGSPAPDKPHFSRWIQDDLTAKVVKGRRVRRFAYPPLRLICDLDRGKAVLLNVGDIVRVTTKAAPGPDGAPIQRQPYQVVRKKRLGGGKYEYDLWDTTWSRKWIFIAPAGLPDATSATEEQKEYWYIGRAADNRINNGAEEGSYIF